MSKTRKRKMPRARFEAEVNEAINRAIADGRMTRTGDVLELTDRGWLHMLATKAAAIPDDVLDFLDAFSDEEARPEQAADVARVREVQVSGRWMLKLMGWDK